MERKPWIRTCFLFAFGFYAFAGTHLNAQTRLPFSNADFSSGNLTNWTVTGTGTKTVRSDGTGNDGFWAYGQEYASGMRFVSPVFAVQNSDRFLRIKWKRPDNISSAYAEIQDTNNQIIQRWLWYPPGQAQMGNTWVTNSLDLRNWIGKSVQVVFGGGSIGCDVVWITTGSDLLFTQDLPEYRETIGSLFLQVATVGSGPVSYQWYKDSVALDGQTGASLSLSGVATSLEGKYFLRASNAAGSIDSTTVLVKDGKDTDGDGLSDNWEAGFGRFKLMVNFLGRSEVLRIADSLGMRLATLTSQIEQDWVRLNYPSIMGGSVGLGGYHAANRPWGWVSGETWSFTNWASGN